MKEHKPKCPFHLVKDKLLSSGKFKQSVAKAKGHSGGINTAPQRQPEARTEKSGIFDRVLDD
jgi:hypothetical protein